MKKIKYLLLPVAGLLTLASCDLETEPTTYVSETLVFDNLQNAEYVLNGTWRYLWDGSGYAAAPGGIYTWFLNSDIMGHDVAEPNRYGFNSVYTYTTTLSGTATNVTVTWQMAYKAIDNLNNLLANIDDIPGSDEDYRARIKAQALALRAYIYLHLGIFYADDYVYNPEQGCVPMPLVPTQGGTEGEPLSSTRTVIDRAETDALDALKLMESVNYSRDTKYRVDANVINGILARIYVHKQNWSDARKHAALAHAGYSWMSTDEYLEGFNDLTNPEWIWGHLQTDEQSSASYTFHFKDTSSNITYYYSMMADPYFMDELFDLTDGDIRNDLFEWSTSRAIGYLMYKKFVFRDNWTADLLLMRKAEMVLIEAEACARLDLPGDAITALNQLRNARNAPTPDLSALSKDDLIEEILNERRKELWGEGFSLSDIKRLGKKVERRAYPDNVPIAPGSNVMIQGHRSTNLGEGKQFTEHDPVYNFSIPNSEYTNNPNL